MLKSGPDRSLLGVKFKISDEHPRLFHMGVPPGVPFKFFIIITINLYLYTKSYHFYMVFLGIVCKIILKYSKKLLDYKVNNNNKLYLRDHTSTFLVFFLQKLCLGIKITTHGNYVTLIIICPDHQNKLKYILWIVCW